KITHISRCCLCFHCLDDQRQIPCSKVYTGGRNVPGRCCTGSPCRQQSHRGHHGDMTTHRPGLCSQCISTQWLALGVFYSICVLHCMSERNLSHGRTAD